MKTIVNTNRAFASPISQTTELANPPEADFHYEQAVEHESTGNRNNNRNYSSTNTTGMPNIHICDRCEHHWIFSHMPAANSMAVQYHSEVREDSETSGNSIQICHTLALLP